MSAIIEGGCLCGAVRYRLEREPVSSLVCHCRTCCRTASAPGVGWLTVARDAFVVTAGSLAIHASSPGVERGHCAACGSPLTWSRDPEDLDVTTLSLDDPARFPPDRAVWVSHRVAWASPDVALPQYPRNTQDGLDP